MIVTKSSLHNVLETINSAPFLSLDTECTGLFPYQGDRLFSIIVSTKDEDYYFNFNTIPDHLGGLIPADYQLDRSIIPKLLTTFSGVLFLHNAKYDMAMVFLEGLDLSKFELHCTQSMGRVEKNTRLKSQLSLAFLGHELGWDKSDVPKDYCNEHKIYDWIKRAGKAKRSKDYHYELIPFDIIVPYGERDGRVTFIVGMSQIKNIAEQDTTLPESLPKLNFIVKNEKLLTPVLFHVEQRGMKLDIEYTKKCLAYETQRYEEAASEFTKTTGIEFKDSNKVLAMAFTEAGETFPTTEKGNPSFKEDVLKSIDSPLSRIVKAYRAAHKKAGTYYANFLELVDDNGIIHCNLNQGFPRTGRLSSDNPNLQNLPKRGEDKSEYPARRCFIPQPGTKFFMFDYDQMEYKLMLDYAAEMSIIRMVWEGMCVHQATAEVNGCTRDQAKTINFALLYGVGNEALGVMLGCTTAEARERRLLYFSRLPKVAQLINSIKATADRRGYIFNKYGRRYLFDRKSSYKAPNYLIQGGCADIIKQAMVRIEKFFGPEVPMLVQVHDELIFQFTPQQEAYAPIIKNIMEEVYQYKHLPLTCGVDYSAISWHDKEEYNV